MSGGAGRTETSYLGEAELGLSTGHPTTNFKGEKDLCEHPRYSRLLLVKLTENNVRPQGRCLVRLVCVVFLLGSPASEGKDLSLKGTAC